MSMFATLPGSGGGDDGFGCVVMIVFLIAMGVVIGVVCSYGV